MTVTVTRVSRKTTTTRTVLKYDTVEKQDADAEVGSRKVTTKGVSGLQQVTYVETYVNGKLTSRKVAKVTVLKQPVDEVVVVGPEPPPTQPAECADFPTTGGLNWCGLAKCESGLNPNAYNPAGPYYGLYQFDQGTWTSNGGTGTPSGKSIAEQTRVAYNLYQARGALALAGLRPQPLTCERAPAGRRGAGGPVRGADAVPCGGDRGAARAGGGPRAGGGARPPADQGARAELPARPEHDPPHRPHRRRSTRTTSRSRSGPGSAR